MPAINALLPIVAASNSQKDGAQSRSEEPRNNAIKSSAKAESKGVDQDAAAEKRMREKRFISVYEEGLQEQGKLQERVAKQAAERLRLQEKNLTAVAASGSTLPPVGEPLPIATVPIDPLEPTQNAADTLHTQVPPQTSEEASAALPTEPTTTPVLTAQEQQQAAAAFHALVSAQNGKAQGQASTSQGIQQAALADVENAPNIALSMEQSAEDSATSSQNDADASNLISLETSLAHETGEASANARGLSAEAETASRAAVLSDETPLNLAIQTEQAQDTVSAELKAALLDREPSQAERVRAWRGVDAQEMRSSATTTSATQVARQDSLTPPVAHSGQLRQFAQSLRLSAPQADSTSSVVSSERGTTTSPATLTASDSSPWRVDSPSTGTQTSGVRTLAANTPFAQTMQASNFGQPLGEPVGQNAWGERIAQRVSLMAGQKVTSAEIQLDPPELGAMTIKVSVNGDQASVSFHSPHALVRDALELSFPRLQEMMSQQGMQLVDAQVADNGFAGQNSGNSSGDATGQPSAEGFEESANLNPSQIVQVATGLIDFYA